MNLNNTDFIIDTQKRYDGYNFEDVVIPKQVNAFELDTPQRGILRIDHLINTVSEPFDTAKERLIGPSDLMSINFLQIGFLSGKPICRIHVRNEMGSNLGKATGFLISPSLLITNNHVFENEASALKSLAEFNYQYDVDGNPPTSTDIFELDPGKFFKTNPDLDYTIVAIKKTAFNNTKNIADFGYLKLFEDSGKALVSEHLSIIQHPGGDFKKIALRENRVITALDSSPFITYTTDTVQGSSGSGVFNDQWQVVALHHSGVPRKDAQGNWLTKSGSIWAKGMDDNEIDWIANEGVRISSIIKDLRFTHSGDPLFKEMIEVPAMLHKDGIFEKTLSSEKLNDNLKNNINMQQNSLTVNIPLEVTVKIGTANAAPAAANPLPVQQPAIATDKPFEIKKSIEPNYKGRNGYIASFVEKDDFKIELDELLRGQISKLAPILNPTDDNKYYLHYFNFSVAINKSRRLCAITAVNIDGKRSESLDRENNPWIIDPRMNAKYQTGPAVYASNDLDRGHMVRRLDPVWGPNAKAANDDTFHYSNSAPQHKNLNQKTWLSLEEYILGNADKANIKVSVFTGPVFGEDDFPYRDVLLPMKFWKVAAMIKADGTPSVTGYMLSQPNEIDDFRTAEGIKEDGFGAFKTYQVSLAKIEKETGLHFGKYSEFDPLQAVGVNEISTFNVIEKMEDIRI